MAPDRKDFLALLEKKQEKQAQVQAFKQDLLKQASVKAQYLTNDEKWDHYLSFLQAKLDEAKNGQLEWMEAAACAFTVDQIKLAQMNYAIYNERVRCLEECMSLPITLIAESKKAQ